ncbi:hypothetical protein SADUNF_Sadunf10G0051300 [Salix dunnii]|uniref:Uncharacterized protein n=1 Tax=Salix dunnii TaxID=1413687 RepID=A0A835JSC8_9ROSI|nr:hypothetical protein SADUNF_Sadunf10G0051300 [Salix dunnii]
MDVKRVYEELNSLLPCGTNVKTQQSQPFRVISIFSYFASALVSHETSNEVGRESRGSSMILEPQLILVLVLRSEDEKIENLALLEILTPVLARFP